MVSEQVFRILCREYCQDRKTLKIVRFLEFYENHIKNESARTYSNASGNLHMGYEVVAA